MRRSPKEDVGISRLLPIWSPAPRAEPKKTFGVPLRKTRKIKPRIKATKEAKTDWLSLSDAVVGPLHVLAGAARICVDVVEGVSQELYATGAQPFSSTLAGRS